MIFPRFSKIFFEVYNDRNRTLWTKQQKEDAENVAKREAGV